MKLSDLELVKNLEIDLEYADQVLAAFEAEPGPLVRVRAVTGGSHCPPLPTNPNPPGDQLAAERTVYMTIVQDDGGLERWCQPSGGRPAYRISSKTYNVDLLPVPKEVAVSAARRAREKIVTELAHLGVEVQ